MLQGILEQLFEFAAKSIPSERILEAKKSKLLTKIALTTDDERIIKHTKKYKLDFVIKRKKKYSTDYIKSINLIKLTINYLNL